MRKLILAAVLLLAASTLLCHAGEHVDNDGKLFERRNRSTIEAMKPGEIGGSGGARTHD